MFEDLSKDSGTGGGGGQKQWLRRMRRNSEKPTFESFQPLLSFKKNPDLTAHIFLYRSLSPSAYLLKPLTTELVFSRLSHTYVTHVQHTCEGVSCLI